jgi:hypothetical protein
VGHRQAVRVDPCWAGRSTGKNSLFKAEAVLQQLYK